MMLSTICISYVCLCTTVHTYLVLLLRLEQTNGEGILLRQVLKSDLDVPHHLYWFVCMHYYNYATCTHVADYFHVLHSSAYFYEVDHQGVAE